CGLPGELCRLVVACAAERLGIPWPRFGPEDARALTPPCERLRLRALLADKLRDAVYGLDGELLPYLAGDAASARYGEPGEREVIVEWHELL
ncbi:hypothetical protein, partial [Salmonella enterica]|uniref:hypothetical protein n=1 Tax=Salmonella enterica TaxID=28901 RepID=UPI003296CC4D